MTRSRRPVADAPLAQRLEAALTAKRGHAVHVRAEEREGLWQAKAVDPRTPGGLMIAGAAGYATERAALEALAGLCGVRAAACTCNARRGDGHALACAKAWGQEETAK